MENKHESTVKYLQIGDCALDAAKQNEETEYATLNFR